MKNNKYTITIYIFKYNVNNFMINYSNPRVHKSDNKKKDTAKNI